MFETGESQCRDLLSAGAAGDLSGLELAAVLDDFEECRADADALVDALRSTARLISWAQARQVDVIAEIARREPEVSAPRGLSPLEPAAMEVGTALNWSPATARNRVHEAVDLTQDRRATLTLLRRGEIDWPRLRAVVDSVSSLPVDTAARVEEQVLWRAPRQTPAQLRASLRRAVARHDARGTDERFRVAVAGRRVVFSPLPDGMAEMWAVMPADAAVRIESALNRVASRRGEKDERCADERRLDALVDLVSKCGPSGTPADADGKHTGRQTEAGSPASRPEVVVTIPLGTILGLSDEPAYLAGYGPIPDALARRLAADGCWRRITTDPDSGAVLDVGRKRYQPPAALDDFVRMRDAMCRFPGCRRRASACDLDHTVPFPFGSTSAENLHALCRSHHRLKHESDWSVRVAGAANQLVWTSPAKRDYATSPPDPGGEAETVPLRNPARAGPADPSRRPRAAGGL